MKAGTTFSTTVITHTSSQGRRSVISSSPHLRSPVYGHWLRDCDRLTPNRTGESGEPKPATGAGVTSEPATRTVARPASGPLSLQSGELGDRAWSHCGATLQILFHAAAGCHQPF